MSDVVLPVGEFDTYGMEKDSIVLTGWVLDGLLDSKKVENAYKKLTEIWPVLSARLRTNKETQKWEYHLPSEFSASRPQYIFKTITMKGSVHDQYKYSKPSDTISLTIKENPYDLYSQGGSRGVQEFMKKDIPMVQLQLTFFDDATLVGLTTPHVLCDGHGNKEIMNALSRILHGEAVAPLQPGDPLARFSSVEKSVEAPPYWKIFSAWQALWFIGFLLWDFFWNRDIQNRDLFLPKQEVVRIKQEAMDDLKKEHGDGDDFWISTSDALTAFMLKCIYPPTASQTPLNVLYSANARKYIADVMPKPYLHNGAFNIVTPTIPISAISTMSLGALAYHIRKALRAQTTPDAIRRCIRWHIANAGHTAVFFEPTGAWNVVTNWRDMKLMDIDFSGALPDGAEKVKCVYLWGNSFQPFPTRNCMGLVADDPSGGVWIGGYLSKRVWERSDGFGRFVRS